MRVAGVLGVVVFAAMLTGCGGQGQPVLPERAGYVAPSAVNGKIVFVSDRTGNRDVWVMNPDGSGQTNLTKTPDAEIWPDWSPDGKKIVFCRWMPSESVYAMYTMKADGSGQTRIHPPSYSSTHPVWSPDGTLIAYAAAWASSELWTCLPDGSDRRKITNNTAYDGNPAWAPNSQRLVFESNRLGNYDIFAMNLDRTGLARLTKHAADEYYPSWSAACNKILFRRNADIFVMNADGSQQQNLTASPSTDEVCPRWAPSGNRIVYASNKYGHFDIFTMKADGTDRRRLTIRPGDDTMPSWAVATP